MSYKVKLICLHFSVLFAFLLLLQPAFSQKKAKDFGSEKFPDLDGLLSQNQRALGEKFILLVSNRDTVVYKKTIGEFDDRTAAPAASASKWLTAALILQLVDDGKLSLDDKVSSFIPLYSLYGKNYITIRNCLSHYTGIQADPVRFSTLLKKKKYGSLEEEVNDYAKNEIQANPGTEFRYSDIGLNIAARVAEIVTKKKFEMLIRQKLLIPLNMRQTSFTNPDGSAPDPSAGAVSSASDYMHFLQMLLHNGVYNGQKVLSENAVTLMRTVQTTSAQIKEVPKTAQGYQYALGSWAIEGGAQQQATVLSSPGFSGTWPVVDFCRGYACIILLKTPAAEQKAEDADKQIMAAVSGHFTSGCTQ